MKKQSIITTAITVLVLFALSVGALLLSEHRARQNAEHPYVTYDINDYGTYKGTFDNKAVTEYINSFFPEKIEDCFSDITYSYRTRKGDTYAYEAYLEFVIEDKESYQTFVDQHTGGLEKKTFDYDESFSEYTVDHNFDIWIYGDEKDAVQLFSDIHIEYAKIGKILCCDEEQRIIFIALGVFDGGVATVDYLCSFFNRFAINPIDMATSDVDYQERFER